MNAPGRGEIFLVDFYPTRGHEIQKTRPALVIQNDIGNRYSGITIVAAITSKRSLVPHPVEVLVQPTKTNGLLVPSSIHLGQIRSIDQRCLVKRLGVIDAASMRKVEDALLISLGIAKV